MIYIFDFIGIRRTPIQHFPPSGNSTARAEDSRTRITVVVTGLPDNVTPPDTETAGGDRKLNSSQMVIDPTVVTNLMVINPTEKVIKVTETDTKVITADIVVMERGSNREGVIDIIVPVGNQQNMK